MSVMSEQIPGLDGFCHRRENPGVQAPRRLHKAHEATIGKPFADMVLRLHTAEYHIEVFHNQGNTMGIEVRLVFF